MKRASARGYIGISRGFFFISFDPRSIMQASGSREKEEKTKLDKFIDFIN